ncbi:hypothetical protein [Paenibacillus gansuensis]|uniref:Adhesin domain-containing protein n=1 Tax=Paenibacillus gansuensis TaxID=306542 RepID=A0ABW5PKI7_9BACL
MDKRRWIALSLLGCLLLLFVSLAGYVIYKNYYSDSGILERVLEQKKYSLTVKKNAESVEVTIDPLYIARAKGVKGTLEIHIPIHNVHNTSIYLESITNH